MAFSAPSKVYVTVARMFHEAGLIAIAVVGLAALLCGMLMTRLRQPDRRVLDTLVDAGVARSRADALVWCVRLVGEHTESWLTELREAMTSVDEVRSRGPEL